MRIWNCARPASALNQANAEVVKAEARNVGNLAHLSYPRPLGHAGESQVSAQMYLACTCACTSLGAALIGRSRPNP